jgi:hypothetical protein
MTRNEPRGIASLVYVGRDDTVQVTPTDNKSQDDSAFVDAFDVVAHPGDGVGDARIDAESAEESACVSNGRSVTTNKHSESISILVRKKSDQTLNKLG